MNTINTINNIVYLNNTELDQYKSNQVTILSKTALTLFKPNFHKKGFYSFLNDNIIDIPFKMKTPKLSDVSGSYS